ncbi:TonB-dependent receptor [Xanthomonas sp. CFBP 8445]|uniref:TonB-dependent receptor n=1 Tax=Xanthomonas sp. CFBP 8445 TaxID=2971236 RepID=UPI0021DF6255|nr:TonB-dependent receptor [Xanthomonas sp. CFBP 8445]UYC10638.1 TonB-dependent receptor [Xanthomonas sp. CFBP 8445]
MLLAARARRPLSCLPAFRPVPLACAVAAGLACCGAAAQSADRGETTTLTRIVVTAEKQARAQHDTATSADVLSEQELRRRGFFSSRDVFGAAANVVYLGQDNAAPAIRGIDGSGAAVGVDAYFAGSRPRLGITLDGRPLSFNEIVFGSSGLWDVEQTELLRGPQSLLQGRNAIAGTLAIKTHDPVFVPEGAVLFSAGNLAHYQGALYFNTPLLADELALRVAADVQHHDSALAYSGYPRVSRPGRFETRDVRAKLLYTPKALPGVRQLLTLQHTDAIAPQSETTSFPYTSRIASTPQMPVFRTRANALLSDTLWPLGERLAFHSLFTATDLHVDREAMPRLGIADLHANQYTLEPNLVLARGDSVFSGLVGLYLFRARQDERIDYPFDERFHDRVDTAAVYAQATLALSERLEVTVGARYERERHRRDGGDAARYIALDFDETWRTFLPKLDLAWHPSAAWTVGLLAQRGYNAGGGGVTLGYPQATIYRYAPEYVRDYELYVRGELAEGRLQVNGNLFHGDYRGLQLPFLTSTEPYYQFVIRNARRAHNAGAEVGLRWLATSRFDLHANLGLLRTRITDDAGWGTRGNAFANAPRVTGGIGASWRGASGLDLSLDLRHSGAYYSDVQNTPLARIGPYWLGRASGGYHLGNVYLFAGVNNLFDHRDPLMIYVYAKAGAYSAYNTGTMPEPRTWYAGLRVDFR